jgi:hypothetical protein
MMEVMADTSGSSKSSHSFGHQLPLRLREMKLEQFVFAI